jgi:hypothetical protein
MTELQSKCIGVDRADLNEGRHRNVDTMTNSRAVALRYGDTS